MHSVNKLGLRVLGKLCEGLIQVGDHKTIDNAPGAFMAVHVEIIDRKKAGLLVSVAHYFEQNRDLCRDPDVVILKTDEGAYPVSFQQDIPPVYQEVMRFDDSGSALHVNAKAQLKLTMFVNELLANINEQQRLEA